jgi:NAD-dependent SIR2 family protein deacetylase
MGDDTSVLLGPEPDRLAAVWPSPTQQCASRFGPDRGDGSIRTRLDAERRSVAQAAGNERVIDLDSRLDLVRCMRCEEKISREELQSELLQQNINWLNLDDAAAPDGDADLDAHDFSTFNVPACHHCDGVLKPDVIFFGASVPHDFVDLTAASLKQADGMLIVGSSLMVYSDFRFVQWHLERDCPSPQSTSAER